MTPDLTLVVLCFLSGIVFAFVRLLLAGKVSVFWIDALSLMAALLVFASRNILGIKI